MPDDWKIVFTRLDYFLAFGLGSGLAPVAPGTAGSALGLLLFIPALYAPFPVQVIIIVIGFVLGVWVSDRVAKHMEVKDPGGIVWDEFVGMWITLLWFTIRNLVTSRFSVVSFVRYLEAPGRFVSPMKN